MHNNFITPNYKASNCCMCDGVDYSFHATVICPKLHENKLIIIKILKKLPTKN